MKKKNYIIEIAKWLFIILLILITVINYSYNENKTYIKILLIIQLIIILSMINKTIIGYNFINFINETRMEVYKVIWPTKKETLNTTLVISIITIIISCILWILDNIILHIVSFITNLRL